MRPELAIERLEQLKASGWDEAGSFDHEQRLPAWRANVREVVGRSLGLDHPLIEKLDGVWRAGPAYGEPSEAERTQDRLDHVTTSRGYINAAIYALELSAETDEPVDKSSFDPELWLHVRGLVESGDWGKVATQAAVFTEDKMRKWSAQDASVVGKGLYANALGDAGELRLGALKSEWEGWRGLGMGFAQAIGNVDRHQVQSRADIRRYAVGALGLASLLLTQMRHQHSEVIEERDPQST